MCFHSFYYEFGTNINFIFLFGPTGADGKVLNPESIGECLFAAIDDYNSENSKSSVVDVQVVIQKENAACKPAILSALQSKVTFSGQTTSPKTTGKSYRYCRSFRLWSQKGLNIKWS